MTDDQLDELMNRASTATPLSRLSHAEQRVVFRWLISEGHMTFTGKQLDSAPGRQKPKAFTREGQPIYG